MNSETDYEDDVPDAAAAARKRAAAKKRIELYFQQLTDGCGDPQCTNDTCASSGKLRPFTPDEAAGEALRLFACHAKLCSPLPAKVPRIPTVGSISSPMNLTVNDRLVYNSIESVNSPLDEDLVPNLHNSAVSIADGENNQKNKSDEAMDSSSSKLYYSVDTDTGNQERHYLTENNLLEMITQCESTGCYTSLSSMIFEVFSNVESLKQSFQRDLAQENLTKEDIRAMEIDQDKDEDSKDTQKDRTVRRTGDVDVAAVRRAFGILLAIPGQPFQNALIYSVTLVCQRLEIEFRYYRKSIETEPELLNIFVIIMEIPMLECPEYLEGPLPSYCKALDLLPVSAQAKLAHVWSAVGPIRLKEMTDTVHQLITLRVVTGRFVRGFYMNDEEVITAATKMMKILYCANILGGTMDPESVLFEETTDLEDASQDFPSISSKERKQHKPDPLFKELNLEPLLCRQPVVPYDEFYNEPLCDQLEMDRDFSRYKSDTGQFSFMNHSFILTPAVKALGLYYDNRITMYNERSLSVINSLVLGEPPNPYLRLRVRRDHLIDDALVGLEVLAMESPSNLKKQLVVEFDGEQGIDEGGISKEFFQLMIDELFNPDFAMFSVNSETQTYWFNPTSFESDAQFTLIGIILGLAIYNNVILDIHFPMIVYKKLMGKKGTFYDLNDWNPGLARGLQQLLDYDGDDIEDVFMQTFRITYQDVFDVVLKHDLKENGDKILVNHRNKQEFVDLYANFLLNVSVERQFNAFRKGFRMVTEDSPLKILFHPEEIELLVCGSRNFDFNALEESTDYDGGYTPETSIIRTFWQLVHEFSLEQKRKLLQFTTGSDRVPVGGLSKLKLVIARSGPDSDRLPTAHTCFNVLLLPEYSSKEKLQERLLKAINYSKGFGML